MQKKVMQPWEHWFLQGKSRQLRKDRSLDLLRIRSFEPRPWNSSALSHWRNSVCADCACDLCENCLRRSWKSGRRTGRSASKQPLSSYSKLQPWVDKMVCHGQRETLRLVLRHRTSWRIGTFASSAALRTLSFGSASLLRVWLRRCKRDASASSVALGAWPNFC